MAIREFLFDVAAHVFAVWLSVANWIGRHRHLALMIWIATILFGVKF
jgi:hypothetical protein